MYTMKINPLLNLKIINTSFRTVSIAPKRVNVTERNNVKPWKEIPGPSTLPIIGQLHHFLPGGSLYNVKTYDIWEELYQKYGPIIKLDIILMPPTTVLVDPDSIAQVLRAENFLPHRPFFGNLYYYRRYYKKSEEQINDPYRPTGLISSQGEEWKRFRSAVNPILLPRSSVKCYSKEIDEIAQSMVLRIKKLRNENNMVPTIIEECKRWSLEANAFVALGRRINCIGSNLDDTFPVKQLFDSVNEYMKLTEKLDFKPSLWKYYPTKNFRKAMDALEVIEKITNKFVQVAKDDLNRATKTDEQKSVLEKLLEKDEQVATLMACDMLFGGGDNGAIPLLGLMYLMAINPEQQKKLREKLTTDERKLYLKAFVKESMRLLPLGSGNIRQTTKDHNVMGYHIPKDTYLITNHQSLSTSESQFHRAKEFLPERWIVGKEDPLYYGNAHPFAFLPFGFGTRSCLGRRLIEVELETMLAHLIENFTIEWIGPPPEIEFIIMNVIHASNFIFKDITPSNDVQ